MEEYPIIKSLFSHRKGLIPVNTILQTECMPIDVVNALVSCYCLFSRSLAKLESRGVYIHPRLKEGMEKFYVYSNQPDTGIRHALMDDDGKYVPSKAEAYYMLITCSAFLNFLQMKVTQTKSV